jgi:hypothetical protein
VRFHPPYPADTLACAAAPRHPWFGTRFLAAIFAALLLVGTVGCGGTEPDGNPTPVVTSITPTGSEIGSSEMTLTVVGTGFVPSSIVRWNYQDRPTFYTNASELRAAIPRSDLSAVATAAVTVYNPPPGGGASSARAFTIRPFEQPVATIALTPTSVSCLAGTSTAIGVTVHNATSTPAVQFQASGSSFTVSSSGTGAVVACTAPGSGAVTVTVRVNPIVT